MHLQGGWKGHGLGSVVSCSSRTNNLSAAGVRMKSTAFGGKLNTLQGSLGRIVLDLFFFSSPQWEQMCFKIRGLDEIRNVRLLATILGSSQGPRHYHGTTRAKPHL